MGFLSDLIHGKEKTYEADGLAGDINAAGKSGIGMMTSGANRLNALAGQDPSNLVDTQIATENKLLRNASEDASRRTRQLIAQRGMGNSSIGLGQEVGQGRELSEKMALNNASGLDRLRNMQMQNGQLQMQAGQGLFGLKQAQGPVQMQDLTQRTGGFGQLIGAGLQAGAMMYSPKTAAAGAGFQALAGNPYTQGQRNSSSYA